MERLKRVRGTVDVTNENTSSHHKPSELLKLNPGVNINEQGRKIKGPKLKDKFRSTLQDYFSKRDKNLITKLATSRIKSINDNRKQEKSSEK